MWFIVLWLLMGLIGSLLALLDTIKEYLNNKIESSKDKIKFTVYDLITFIIFTLSGCFIFILQLFILYVKFKKRYLVDLKA